MRHSLNRRVFFMINLLIFVIFSLLFLMNYFFMDEFYGNHKRRQIVNVADKLKKTNYYDIREVGEKNNLRIEILSDMELKQNLIRFSRGPFPRIDKSGINVEDLGKERKVLTFVGRSRENRERMILLIEKIDENKFLVIYSPIYAIGEALQITGSFIFYIFLIAIFFSVIISIIISRKISKPIVEINRIAHSISELDFTRKLEMDRNDEVGDLASSINRMSDSLRATIEDLKVSNERLKQEISKEKLIDKMRREFVSNVNHELKTPIALIKGFTEGLRDNIASPEDRDYYLEVIEDECNNMDALVKRLLLLSKYESEFEIEKTEFDMESLINDLLKRYRYDLEKKDIKVFMEVKENFLMIADFKELKIAIDNLLRNAISYTGENTTIEILCEKIENKHIFSIKNPYKELKQEEIEKLWIPFNKEDKARTRKFGGTGLGLSIIAAIMKKHDFSYGAVYEQEKIKFYFYEERE